MTVFVLSSPPAGKPRTWVISLTVGSLCCYELHFAISKRMRMHMDNQVAIKQLESEGSMAIAKHVDIRIKFICDYARKGIVEPKYVESRLMQADLLTKAFPAPRMAELRQIVKLT
jgi:hypothetical protein